MERNFADRMVEKLNFWNKLKRKWNIETDLQAIWIFVIFAITGSSLLFVKEPVVNFFHLREIQPRALFWVIYILFFYFFYQVLLISWGTLLGQRKFFWWMLKRMNGRFIKMFSKNGNKGE